MSQCQQRPPKSQLENRQAANRTTAVIVPALLIGIVGYATWIVVVLIGGESFIVITFLCYWPYEDAIDDVWPNHLRRSRRLVRDWPALGRLRKIVANFSQPTISSNIKVAMARASLSLSYISSFCFPWPQVIYDCS